MYFAAACFIGLRPVVAHVPRRVKNRIQRSYGTSRGTGYGLQTVSGVGTYKSTYKPFSSDYIDGDLESNKERLNNMGGTTMNTIMSPGTALTVDSRRRSSDSESLGRLVLHPQPGDIHIQTRIEVQREGD